MFRIIATVVWLLLSAWLVIWVGEGLFGVNQRQSILPFNGENGFVAPIMIGVAWGVILTFGGMMSAVTGPKRVRGETHIGVGQIVEVSRTGVTVNDVPRYDIFIKVTPATGGDFIGQLQMLVDPGQFGALQVGASLPVRYSLANQDIVSLADLTDPAVREATLNWRIERGLIAPSQVRARTTGIQVPASVISVRPTGRRSEGQTELQLSVLLAPEGAATWEAVTTVFVYPEAVSRLQVGSPIWAFYRREDPQTVAVTIEKEPGR